MDCDLVRVNFSTRNSCESCLDDAHYFGSSNCISFKIGSNHFCIFQMWQPEDAGQYDNLPGFPKSTSNHITCLKQSI